MITASLTKKGLSSGTDSSVGYLPDQHIHSSKKGADWGIKCIRAIRSMSTQTSASGRSSRKNKEENYDLVNGKFKESDFDYVLNPYGIDIKKFGGTPTKMQNYNIIRSRLETLRGEEMNSPLNFFVYAIGGEAVSAKHQLRKEVLKDLMKAQIRLTLQLDEQITELEGQMAELQQAIQTVQDQQQLHAMRQQMQELTAQRNNLPDIQAEMEKFNSKYRHPTEEVNNKILKYLKRKDQLALKFNLGWFHGLVSAEEVYYTGISQGHPSTRSVNPLQFEFDKGANTTFIHEGNWAREEYWLPIGEVIREFGDVLSPTQVKEISEGRAGNIFMQGGMQQGFGYSYDGGQRPYAYNGVSTHAYVMQVAWRSFAKVGTLTYPDPRTGQMEITEVDDTFKLTKELKAQGFSVEWRYETEIWEGTQIGSNIFVNIRAKANQTGNLPYVGYIYNNINSVATSMVDLVKAHQYTYIITFWRLEQELAKAKGRKFIMDMAQLPKSMGWDVDQWMYYFENIGVIWINSKEEGRRGDPNSVANFNQFQSIDMTLSQVVGQYMEVLAKLEALVEDIMGVSPQRMGDVGASETATGAQTSIARSTNVTKPWFYFHDLVKEAVLNELLELAKIAYVDGKELELYLDEYDIATLKIDGDALNASDMACFVTNSFDDRSKKDKMEALLTAAVQQGKASLLDVANVLESESMSYIKATLDEAETKAAEREQASTKMQVEAQEKARAEEREEKALDRQKDIQISREGNEKDILIKKMDITGQTMSAGELQAEGPDVSELAKLTLDERKINLEETKEENRKQEAAKQHELDKKEVKIKEKQANKPAPSSTNK